MNVEFKDVSKGIVDARAIIKCENGMFINEITILRRRNSLSVELPEKSFRGKDNKLHRINIITFANEDKRVVWELELLDAHKAWREKNKRVLVYEVK